MEVRLNIGRYAGDIRDVEPEAARALIAAGNATDPRFEATEPELVLAGADELPVTPAKPKKKGSR
jgi:hypothetical protein